MNDGSYVAVDYGAPVHFTTDEGKTWEDIDNTLNRSRENADLYLAKNGDTARGFAADLRSGLLFTASDGEHSLRMGLASGESADNDNAAEESSTQATDGMEPASDPGNSSEEGNLSASSVPAYNPAAAAEISYPDEKNRGTEELSLAEQLAPTKLHAQILYQNVYENVDLQYDLYSYDVKETIIVNQPLDDYSFSFSLNLDGLTPVLIDDGSIELRDANGETIYLIPAPYMTDATGEYSFDVSYALMQTSDAWTITITADKGWVNAEDRVFPVSIDPTVYFAGNSTNQQIYSGYINDRSPNVHPADSKYYILCGNCRDNDPTAGHSIGLIYVNRLPDVPENCVVTTSMLKLFQSNYSTHESGYYNYPRLYTSQITDSNFSESNAESFLNSLTWNNLSSKVYYGSGTTLENRTTIDYTRTEVDSIDDHLFEITDPTRKWYEGDTGISRLLVLDDGHNLSIESRATFSGYYNGNFGHQPQIIVFYRNTVGVEGYYDYHTQSIGRAGAASVNNFTLGLSLSVPVFSAPSQALPFGLSLSYNAPISDASFTSSASLHTKDYTTSGTGYGWKSSVQQSVVELNLMNNAGVNKPWLIYTDADGTEHYFGRKDGSTTVFEDEDGLGLTITKSTSSGVTVYTMKDKETNTWVFQNGYLTSYTDYNGNALYYAYNENNYSSANSDWMPQNANTVYRVTSVWRKNNGVDSATKLVTLDYTYENIDDNRLRSVVDMAGRSTSFAYDSTGNLTTITYPDGQTASYTYLNANVHNSWTDTTKTFHRMTKARDNEAQYEIRYSYSGSAPLRVSSIKEYSGTVESETPGMSMNFFKANATTAMFRYCGADLDLNTNDDLTARVYFDNWGRPINTVSLDKDAKNMLGVSAGTYTQNADANKDNNRLTHAASGGLQSRNMIYNSGIEHMTNNVGDFSGWTAQGIGAAAARTSSETTPEIMPRTGKYMIKLFLDSYDGTESVYQNVYLTEGTTYVFSAYVNTAAALNMGTGGVYLSFRTNSGDILDASSQILNYKTSTAVEKGWERLEAVFTPDQSGAYQVAVNMKNMKKVILADDLQLEAVPKVSGLGELGASSVNLLQLGGFELPSSAGPNSSKVNDWWTFTTYQGQPRVTIEDDQSRGKIIRLHNEPYRQARAWQTVYVNAPGSRTYLLSGWGKLPVGYTVDATKLKYNNATYERFFGFIVEIHYSGYSTPEYQYIAFNGNVGSWQYTAGVIAPKHPERTVEKLIVKITGDLLPNDALVDDVSLVQEPVQTYTYDEKGNLIAATNSEGKTGTELDSKDRLEKYTAMNGVEYNLHYANSTTRNPDYMTTDGVKTSYEYNSSGSVKKTTIQNNSGGKKLVSAANFDATKNFQTQATDTSGNTSYAAYSTTRGVQTSATDPKGVTTNYTYHNSNNRPKTTYQDGADKALLYYLYNSRGGLKQLNRKSWLGDDTTIQGYHFTYDTWGNTTAIDVGAASTESSSSLSSYIRLASYVYNTNGTLAKMDYPNGEFVTYTYDLLDRLVCETYHKSDESVVAEYHYVYNTAGQLSRQYTKVNNVETERYSFAYDSLGRLIRSREEGDSSLVQRTEHLYDSANRLTAQNWSIGSSGFKEQYAYNSSDGTMASFSIGYTLPNGNTETYKLNYQYDNLKRLDEAIYRFGTDTTPIYTRSYDYLDYVGESSRTTSRLGTYTVKDGGHNLLLGNQYEYDANGNITKVQEAYLSGNTIAYRIAAEYTYDELNQLKTETRKSYSGASATPTTTTLVTYTIDTAGNIRNVETKVDGTVTETVEYTYGNAYWSDRLTAITIANAANSPVTKNISYTSAGGYCNPVSWFNGTEYTNLTWTQGRRLGSITKGSDTYSYEYDMSGIRSAKVANGLRHEYVTQSGRVVRETVYGLDNTTGEYTDFQYALDFTYDEAGHPLTMRRYNNENMQNGYVTMQYVCNAQGDVVKLIYNGTVYAEYSYDAWGNAIIKTGSLNYENVNPLRYQGYYFDMETGFYYLQSRYYDPIVKRFLNADSYASTGQGFLGYNMFAYCGNNPANSSDSCGLFFRELRGYIEGCFRKAVAKCVIIKEKYSSANYNRSKFSERKKLQQDYVYEISAALGIENPPTVFYEKIPPTEIRADDGTMLGFSEVYGYYNNDDNTLMLNEWYMGSTNEYEIMFNTIRHETFHAYQYRNMDGTIFFESKKTIARWLEADAAYTDPTSDFSAESYYKYRYNALEVDARIFAG